MVANPSLIVLKIGIPPATEASNSKFTLFFSANFDKWSPCFEIRALFGVMTCILFFNDNYKSSIDISEKDLELYWEIQWLKDPISNWLDSHYETKNFIKIHPPIIC